MVRKQVKVKRRKIQRRWFATASGWGLNLSLGSGDGAQLKRRSLAISPDEQIYDNQGTVAALTFLTNTIYTHNALSGIIQGTNFGQRIGNAIFIDRMQLSVVFDSSAAANPASQFMVRIMLVQVTDQSSTTNFGSGIGSSSLFLNTTANLVVARTDPRLCNVLCDELVEVKPTVSTAAGTGSLGAIHAVSVGCPINARFEYRAATIYGSAANYYWLMIPQTAGGVGGVTTVCGFAHDNVVAFRII